MRVSVKRQAGSQIHEQWILVRRPSLDTKFKQRTRDNIKAPGIRRWLAQVLMQKKENRLVKQQNVSCSFSPITGFKVFVFSFCFSTFLFEKSYNYNLLLLIWVWLKIVKLWSELWITWKPPHPNATAVDLSDLWSELLHTLLLQQCLPSCICIYPFNCH